MLPYSLKAGTAIWVRNINTGVESSAILAATPLSGDKRTINVEAANNGINTVSVGEIGLPYIRRFIDPRKPIDQSYSLWLTNSSSKHRAPENGDILRFAETPDPGSAGLIVTA